MVSKQGQNASYSGRDLEDVVEDILTRRGYRQLDSKEKAAFVKGTRGPSDFDGAWFVRNAKKYEGVYGVKLFSDFIVFSPNTPTPELIIEVKSQAQAGSVDEKYVYTVLSLKKMIEEHGVSAWLVFSGDGIRGCSLAWMRNQQTEHFKVFMEGEFRRAMRDRHSNAAPPWL